MARKKKRKAGEVNIDLTSIIMIIVGIISAVIIYSKDLGAVGTFIKYGIFGGLFGKVTMAIPIILILLGVYVIFQDFSRLKLKAFQVVMLAISIAGLFSIYAKPQILQNDPQGVFGCLKAFYLSGASQSPSMIGGGIIGGVVSIPIATWFNDLVAMVILWGIAIFSTMIITGITISAVIVAIHETVSEMMDATKKEYANNVIDFKKFKNANNVSSRKSRSSEKFRNIVEQTEIVEAAEQLNFDLDDDQEVEEEYEEV